MLFIIKDSTEKIEQVLTILFLPFYHRLSTFLCLVCVFSWAFRDILQWMENIMSFLIIIDWRVIKYFYLRVPATMVTFPEIGIVLTILNGFRDFGIMFQLFLVLTLGLCCFERDDRLWNFILIIDFYIFCGLIVSSQWQAHLRLCRL